MEVRNSGGVSNHPMHPSGDFPPEGTPNLSKADGQVFVTFYGLNDIVMTNLKSNQI